MLDFHEKESLCSEGLLDDRWAAEELEGYIRLYGRLTD
jgi:hypothetical protein